MNTTHIPLFPLHTVLFPGGPLPLRVFEARYLDMISSCMKNDCGFGVVQIREGREVGEAALAFETGTLARITDWHMRHDGLLGITVTGQQRFRIASVKVERTQLSVARVEMLPEDPELDLPNEYLPLVDMLRKLIDQVHHYAGLPRKYGDAGWVSYRLAELLPIGMEKRQAILEMDDPVQRLATLFETLEGLQIY